MRKDKTRASDTQHNSKMTFLWGYYMPGLCS